MEISSLVLEALFSGILVGLTIGFLGLVGWHETKYQINKKVREEVKGRC